MSKNSEIGGMVHNAMVDVVDGGDVRLVYDKLNQYSSKRPQQDDCKGGQVIEKERQQDDCQQGCECLCVLLPDMK